jgi:hypothetical protein
MQNWDTLKVSHPGQGLPLLKRNIDIALLAIEPWVAIAVKLSHHIFQSMLVIQSENS